MYGGIGLALQLGGNLLFFLVLLCTRGQFPSTSSPSGGGGGGLYLERRFNGRFFALRIWGTYIWRGLYLEGLIFGNLRYSLLNAALDYLYTYKFSNVKVLAKVSHTLNNMGSCSGKEKLVESKTRYQIFLCLLSSRLLFLFPQYRVAQYAL